MKEGDDWMRVAAEVCRASGFETVVENTGALFHAGFPMSQIAFYAGWYSEKRHWSILPRRKWNSCPAHSHIIYIPSAPHPAQPS
ncbi:MAG: hypothetical protein QM813_23120 [Verrucomicrobiota bacterium]